MSEEWIDSEEAAAILGIQKAGIFYRIRRGDLTPTRVPSSRLGGKGFAFRFLRSDVEHARDNWRPQAIKPYDRSPSDIECAYMAGLIDGEGSIIIASKKSIRSQCHTLILSVYNSHEPVLTWIDERFGSSHARIYRNNRGSDRCPVYAWTARSYMAYHVLQATLPYLIIKRDQALVGIEFQEGVTEKDGGRWRQITDEDLAWREERKLRLSALNHRHQTPLPAS